MPTPSPQMLYPGQPTPPRQHIPSPTRTLEVVLNADQTELTGQERFSLETMPMVLPGHSTSQSGASNINVGSRSTDASSSKEDTTEDEVE
jgi:hypothetical protein